MLPDEADLGLAVARDVVPVVEHLGILADELLAHAIRRARDELALLGEGGLLAGLLEHVAHVRVLVGPELALRADDLARPGGHEVAERVDVEGLPALVHERLDAILQHLRVVVLLGVLHRVEPHRRVVDLLEVEAIGVEQLVERHVALLGLNDDGVLLQRPHDAAHLVDLLAAHAVALVEHHRGAELELLDEQALDVVLVDVLGQQVLAAVELVPHARAVHHGHDVVEVERGGAVVLGLVAEARDGVGDGDGLADARGLDDDVVEVARGGNVGELALEVGRERAAEAAVGHRDELAVDLRQAALGDERRVDVDLADVVHEHGGAHALVVGEDVVEQRGLAGAEVAGK